MSRFSTEAEYRALATTATELSWLKQLFRDLLLFLHHVPVLWCDNVSSITLASNPVFHARTKHVEVDYHFIKEHVLRKDLAISFIFGKDNLVDIFTKPLLGPLFLLFRDKLMPLSFPIHLKGDDKDRKTEQHL